MPIGEGMDGIAAIEARVAEICARFAPDPPPAADRAAAEAFAGRLRHAMAPAGPGRELGAGRVDSWIAEAIARTGVPDSWAPALKAIAKHESSFDPAAANLAASAGNLA